MYFKPKKSVLNSKKVVPLSQSGRLNQYGVIYDDVVIPIYPKIESNQNNMNLGENTKQSMENSFTNLIISGNEVITYTFCQNRENMPVFLEII